MSIDRAGQAGSDRRDRVGGVFFMFDRSDIDPDATVDLRTRQDRQTTERRRGFFAQLRLRGRLSSSSRRRHRRRCATDRAVGASRGQTGGGHAAGRHVLAAGCAPSTATSTWHTSFSDHVLRRPGTTNGSPSSCYVAPPNPAWVSSGEETVSSAPNSDNESGVRIPQSYGWTSPWRRECVRPARQRILGDGIQPATAAVPGHRDRRRACSTWTCKPVVIYLLLTGPNWVDGDGLSRTSVTAWCSTRSWRRCWP